MNILITGASGYLGSLLVQRLSNLQAGQPIKLIAADIREAPAFSLNDQIHYVKLDVRSPDVGLIMDKHQICLLYTSPSPRD